MPEPGEELEALAAGALSSKSRNFLKYAECSFKITVGEWRIRNIPNWAWEDKRNRIF